jgi:hypothetical protein
MVTDESAQPTFEMIIKMVSELRYSVSEFQDSIENHLTTIEEFWRSIKSRLATLEARLAGLELHLSSVQPDPERHAEQIQSLLKDLYEISADLRNIRLSFYKSVDDLPQRVM